MSSSWKTPRNSSNKMLFKRRKQSPKIFPKKIHVTEEVLKNFQQMNLHNKTIHRRTFLRPPPNDSVISVMRPPNDLSSSRYQINYMSTFRRPQKTFEEIEQSIQLDDDDEMMEGCEGSIVISRVMQEEIRKFKMNLLRPHPSKTAHKYSRLKFSKPSPRADESLSVVLYQPKLADLIKLSSNAKKESSVKIVELEDCDEDAMEL